MIILHDYSFQNIRSFLDKQTISFEGRDKLIQMDGENRNTGGSSGSGKSTALIAIDYLLGLSDIPSTVLQSWLTKDDMCVEANLTIDKVKTYIRRSKKKGLLLQYGEEEFQGTLAEEKLQQIISIPKNVFKQMIHKKQDEKGFFLNKTAKQMYEFLIDMLDLGMQDKKLNKISEDIKTLTKDIETATASIANIENSIADLESVLGQKVAPTPVDISKLPELIAQKEAINDKLKALEAQKHEAIKAIVKPTLPEFKAYDNATLLKLEEASKVMRDKGDSIDAETQRLNKFLYKISSSKDTIQTKAQMAVDKSKKLQELKNNQCFTCKQHYSGEDAMKTQAQLVEDIDTLKKEIMELKVEVDKEPEILQTIATNKSNYKKITDKYQEIHTRIAEEKRNADEHRKKYDEQVEKLQITTKNQELEITSKFNTAISEIKNQVWPLDSEIQKLQSDKANFDRGVASYENECKSLIAKIDTYKKMHVDEHLKLEASNDKLKVAQEAHRLIKTYTIQVFQDTLNLIGDVATEMISAIPNIQNSSIYFEGCKENQNGAIKDEVTPIITLNGHNKIPIKAFSGGEKTAIELAVDLAVIDVIEAKTGKGANFFILDEPFNGLDSICKEACLEVLRQHDTNKKIIMVDHSSELKEMVSDIITIVKEGESSFVA